jgi:phospholipase/carboxylesterase
MTTAPQLQTSRGGLHYLERPAAGEAAGLLVLHHGRGTDESDLLGLADVLDPERRLQVVSPRAPLRLAGSPGYHWYVVPRVGYPDPDTFDGSVRLLSQLHDELWTRTGIGPERTVLAGFSQGTVMSYALALDGGRPAPAGILAFSGFIPTVPGWEPSLSDRQDTKAFIAHGRQDPIISVEFGRVARDLLTAAGLEVDYHESDVGHSIEPQSLKLAVSYLPSVVFLGGGGDERGDD